MSSFCFVVDLCYTLLHSKNKKPVKEYISVMSWKYLRTIVESIPETLISHMHFGKRTIFSIIWYFCSRDWYFGSSLSPQMTISTASRGLNLPPLLLIKKKGRTWSGLPTRRSQSHTLGTKQTLERMYRHTRNSRSNLQYLTELGEIKFKFKIRSHVLRFGFRLLTGSLVVKTN